MRVEPDGQALIDLASSIDDDRPVDWNAAEQAARDAFQRAVVSELRVLEKMTRVCREPDAGAAALAPEPKAEAVIAPIERTPAPTSWGSLTILEPIGRGAFGTVYRARDNLNRDVALKLFPAPRTDPARAEHVLREGRVLARVRHANVVVVYGADHIDGHVGVWMELIRGRTLEAELQVRDVFSAEETRLVGLDLCRALAAVHDAGLRHRDVKAHNVMREIGGRIVLMDFGAAEPDVQTFETLSLAGTPLYIAPEVLGGQPASIASDIYALGVLLYHLVTGGYPVAGANRREIQRAHEGGRRQRLRDARPDLPEGFVQIVESALAPDPRHRYQTAGQFEHALASVGGPARAPSTQPSPGPWMRLLRQWPTVLAVSATTVALVFWGTKQLSLREPPAATQRAPRLQPPATSPVVPTEASYTISAAFYKLTSRQPFQLAPGDRVALGDTLGLRIEASTAVYVYVVNEDDRGESYLLFPLPGQESANPLSAAAVHDLPGLNVGKDFRWQISSAGGREHFVVFVSPSHLTAFDGLSKTLPHPVAGRLEPKRRLPDSVLGQLRGVGGLVSHDPTSTVSQAHYLFEGVDPIGTRIDSARGVWVRQLTLENPER